MILIFSVSYDPAANGVVSWLDRLGEPFVRVNHDEPHEAKVRIELDNDDFRLIVAGNEFSSGDCAAVWYRKGTFWFPDDGPIRAFEQDPALSRMLEKKLINENRVAGRYFHHLVAAKGIRVLGNPFLGDPNKLIVLHEAARLGLKVPALEVVNRLKPRHLSNPAAYVTKALSDGVYLWDFEEAGRGYFSYTENLAEVLEASPSALEDVDIPISLIQRKVGKRFEVRSFFLDGEFFSCAIFSQNDSQTATDYRKYNPINPNRNVPMDLPAEVSRKLVALFERLELNTGSVDMIVDDAGDFVFLEINPVGMYGNLPTNCNFDIDRAIADWLTRKDVL